MSESPGMHALSRGLHTAANALEALRAWAGAVSPPAELAALVDAVTLRPAPALRRHGVEWLPVMLPPVRLSRIPPRPLILSLSEGRREALDDLLFSLGFDQALVLPLSPRSVGAVLLARPREVYSVAEVRAQRQWAAPLGRTLATFAPRGRRAGASREASQEASREVEVLFDLARKLGGVDGASPAVRAAVDALQRLLQPAAGGVLVRGVDDDGPSWFSWPDSALGRRAVERAARSVGFPAPAGAPAENDGRGEHDVAWLTSLAASTTVGLALAWSERVPESAERVAGTVQASLSLAIDRLVAQRRTEVAHLRAVVEHQRRGIVLLASDRRVRLVNSIGRRWLHSLGAWPGDGGRLDQISSAELAPLVAQARQGRIAKTEIYSPAEGRTFEVEVIPAGPTPLSSGETIEEVVVVLDDVTETRRQKAQLARSEKLAAMGVLISGIVHEINNPLTTILGYTEMLATSTDAAQRGRWLNTMEEEARRCQRIVGDLLTFARPQTPGRRPVALAAIAEKALALVSHSFRLAGITAVLTASPETPAIDADPDAVLQALINLLTNALHALESFAGLHEVRIEIGPEGPDGVVMTVRDSGPGIAPEHLDRVFDPFFTTKPEGKGTGLGLSLVAATVRDHGGVVDVESAPGKGACFRIALPVGVPAPALGAAPRESVPSPKDASQRESAPPRKGGRRRPSPS